MSSLLLLLGMFPTKRRQFGVDGFTFSFLPGRIAYPSSCHKHGRNIGKHTCIYTNKRLYVRLTQLLVKTSIYRGRRNGSKIQHNLPTHSGSSFFHVTEWNWQLQLRLHALLPINQIWKKKFEDESFTITPAATQKSRVLSQSMERTNFNAVPCFLLNSNCILIAGYYFLNTGLRQC